MHTGAVVGREFWRVAIIGGHVFGVMQASLDRLEGEPEPPSLEDVGDGMLSTFQQTLEVAEHAFIHPHAMIGRWTEQEHMLGEVQGVMQRLAPDAGRQKGGLSVQEY